MSTILLKKAWIAVHLAACSGGAPNRAEGFLSPWASWPHRSTVRLPVYRDTLSIPALPGARM